MKPRTWLLVDVSNLAWRAYHSTGHLTHDGNPTGVLYGVLKEVRQCVAKFRTTDVAFCFDTGQSYRSKYFPWYKASRKLKPLSPEEAAKVQGVNDQIDLLRNTHLERIGFGNVLCKRGYEADDIIASVVFNSLRKEDEAIVVTGDHDLYQCITPHSKVYHPISKELVGMNEFWKTYSLHPSLWAKVKAIAGCRSDDIPGVGGLVGEKTACVYLAGKQDQLPKGKVAAIEAGADRIRENLQLTQLPYPGTPVFDLEPGLKVDKVRWDALMTELGFESMKDQSRGAWLPVRGKAAH